MTHAEYARRLFVDAGTAAPESWKVVLYYYASLHAVSHAIWKGTSAPDDMTHGKRLYLLKQSRFSRVADRYKALETWSQDVRYTPWAAPHGPEILKTARQYAEGILAACNVS